MEASDTGDELYIEAINGTNATSNLISNADPWFKFGTPSAGTKGGWKGLKQQKSILQVFIFI